MSEHKTTTYIRRAVKTVLWIVVGIIGLIVLAVAGLQFHVVQRMMAQKAVSILSEKTNSRIEIGSIAIGFTHSVVVKDLFVESQQRDTLLSIQSLAVDVNLLGLFSNEILLKNIQIDALTAHISRTLPDSSFNFDFLINSLSSDSVPAESIPDPSESAPWKIEVGGVHLNNIQGTYDDEVSGLNLRFHLGAMDASIDKFDLNKMLFHVDNISLKNTTAGITQTKESPDDTSASQEVDIGVGSVLLENVQFLYENKVTKEQYYADIGTSTLAAEKIDLPLHHIFLKKFTLENSNIVVALSRTDTTKSDNTDVAVMPWMIALDQLILDKNSVQYDVHGVDKIKALDLHHLRFDAVTLRAENMFFSEKRISAVFEHASFREYSGIELRELSGEITIDSLNAHCKDLILETAKSRIHQNISLSYNSFSDLMTLQGNVKIKADIDDSYLSVSDLLFFQPMLPVKNESGAKIQFSVKIAGEINNLLVEKFNISTGDSTMVDLSGSIVGMPEGETVVYDITLQNFSTTRNDIQSIVVDSLIPKEIIIPSSIGISGMFHGTIKDFSASTIIESSIGSITGNVEFLSAKDSTLSRWKTNVAVDEFDLGSLLNDTTMFGAISLTASAAGKGLNGNDIKAKLNIAVDKAEFNGYPYRNLTVEGTATPKMFEGKAEIQDSNIAFVFNGIINTKKDDPTFKFILDIKGADLCMLKFTDEDIRVAGVVTSDISGEGINDFNGSADVRNVIIVKNNRRYTIDSLVYASVIVDEKTHISIASTIFSGQFDGTITPGKLPDVLKEHFSHYFKLHKVLNRTNLPSQEFSFHIEVHDPSTLTDIFLPDLHKLSVGTIEGNFNSSTKNLNVRIDLPGIDYNDIIIDSLSVRVSSDVDRLDASLNVSSIADSTFRITKFTVSGRASHDSIEVSLQSLRDDGYIKVLLSGLFNSDQDGYRFRFNNDGVMFQNIHWSVPEDNYLRYGKGQFAANNIHLQSAEQSLYLNSSDEKNDRPPLRIEFNNFNLSTLSQIVEREDGLAVGTLNGNVVLQNMEKQMAFTSDLTINDFGFRKMILGDVALKANNQTENTYLVEMDISGNGNQIALNGRYLSRIGGSELDLKLDVTKLNLASIEPFTFGNIQRLSGTMNGRLHITGTMKKPSIVGDLNFSNTAFNPVLLDSYLHLNNGRIVFDSKGIRFSSFDLIDTHGNIASLSGHLLTEDFRKYSYDFRVHTENFLLLNKPASRDALYYGTIILDSDISVKGDMHKQIVTIQAELDKGTNLALVLPESELAVEERRGIIRFVDKKIVQNPIMSRRNNVVNNDTTETERSSMELTSNITVNKDSKLRILIDPIAGDSLVIQGEATLSFTIDPSGKITLTGRYDIVGGSYQLSFGDFIKREFAIAKGSSLTWLGSPFDADVDITAIYTVKATVLELIQNQLSGISQEERNKYKQEIPIQVYLVMKGKLLKPDIHFKLDLPPDKRGVLSGSVYAKLNELNGQESELNKQVFALLVLGRFISENPLASVGGNDGLTDFARSSASQILSAQLNRLSEEYIKGVNLNMGVESYKDYSTGSAEGRTQLQLALSKQLFDERVTVQVGGNVDLEGERSQKNSLNNFAGDLKVLYKLTDDGRWQLQVFRQNTYEGAIDGDITKTGAGVVFTVDYDKLFGFTLKPVSK